MVTAGAADVRPLCPSNSHLVGSRIFRYGLTRAAIVTRPKSRSDDDRADISRSNNTPSGLGAIVKGNAKQLQVQPLVDELLDGLTDNKRGEVWFFAQAALLILLVFPPGPVEVFVRNAGVIAAVSGLILAALGQQSLGNSLSPFPAPRRAEDHELITDGIYTYTRHPMYGGLLLLAFGISAATGSNVRFATSFALYFVLSTKVDKEETALLDRYGKQYDDYRQQSNTKRFIPFLF